jgi:hypothetical protein
VLGVEPSPNISGIEDWRQLAKHREEGQVELDVNRSFVYYPTGAYKTVANTSNILWTPVTDKFHRDGQMSLISGSMLASRSCPMSLQKSYVATRCSAISRATTTSCRCCSSS